MAAADAEGGGAAAAVVHLPGLQDERASGRPVDDGSLDELRHRRAVTNGQAGRALDTARRRYALPVVAIAVDDCFIDDFFFLQTTFYMYRCFQ